MTECQLENYQFDGQSLDPEIIIFNLKERYTGVSATVNALVPLQLKQWRLAYCGTTMSNGIKGMTLRQAINLSKKPAHGRKFRIWHVRRDPEMLVAIYARDILRLPIKVVFTSVAKHRHGFFPRKLISKMDKVICATEEAASYIPNVAKIVPHGIDLVRFSVPKDKLQLWQESGLPGKYGIGIFGRVRVDKGVDIFVDAMIEVLHTLPDATAVIVGLCQSKDQDFLAKLKLKIADANLTKRIIFLGEVSSDEVNLWYQRCLVCVACPRYEPFGLTPFEAAACGCALICSKTGAFEDLIDEGVNGKLIPIGDVQSLVNALKDLVATPHQTLAKGLMARHKIERNFSLQQEADGIGMVYQQLFDEET